MADDCCVVARPRATVVHCPSNAQAEAFARSQLCASEKAYRELQFAKSDADRHRQVRQDTVASIVCVVWSCCQQRQVRQDPVASIVCVCAWGVELLITLPQSRASAH